MRSGLSIGVALLETAEHGERVRATTRQIQAADPVAALSFLRGDLGKPVQGRLVLVLANREDAEVDLDVRMVRKRDSRLDGELGIVAMDGVEVVAHDAQRRALA